MRLRCLCLCVLVAGVVSASATGDPRALHGPGVEK